MDRAARMACYTEYLLKIMLRWFPVLMLRNTHNKRPRPDGDGVRARGGRRKVTEEWVSRVEWNGGQERMQMSRWIA